MEAPDSPPGEIPRQILGKATRTQAITLGSSSGAESSDFHSEARFPLLSRAKKQPEESNPWSRFAGCSTGQASSRFCCFLGTAEFGRDHRLPQDGLRIRERELHTDVVAMSVHGPGTDLKLCGDMRGLHTFA